MLKNMSALFLLCLVFSGCFDSLKTQSESDVLGVKIGMSKADAIKRLKEIGRLEKEEKKQQEVWAIDSEPHYSYVIIAFDKENDNVRYITAKARENGSRVRYADVLDIDKSRQTNSANNYKYVQEIPGSLFAYGYSKLASGTDPDYLTYFSLKKTDSSGEESEEDVED